MGFSKVRLGLLLIISDILLTSYLLKWEHFKTVQSYIDTITVKKIDIKFVMYLKNFKMIFLSNFSYLKRSKWGQIKIKKIEFHEMKDCLINQEKSFSFCRNTIFSLKSNCLFFSRISLSLSLSSFSSLSLFSHSLNCLVDFLVIFGLLFSFFDGHNVCFTKIFALDQLA